MSELELEQLQEKIDAGILLAQQRLKEKVLREDGQLVVMRDGKVTHLTANDLKEEYSSLFAMLFYALKCSIQRHLR